MQLLNNSAAEGGVPAWLFMRRWRRRKEWFCGSVERSLGAIRVTMGTEKENDDFLKAITTVLAGVHALAPKGHGQETKQDQEEQAANDILHSIV